MCLHTLLLTACFIIHNTDIQTLATMYKLMFLHIRLLNECLITQITDRDTGHYVSVGVSSYESSD